MASAPKFVVVIGTSTGGISAVEELVKQLTPEMDAAFFIVHHVSRKGVGDVLFYRLQHVSPLKCKLAEDEEKIEKGVIYVAPPDAHMVLLKDKIGLRKSASENRWRPSINNLFRSAAATYSSRVIGVILSGLLDDGTSGMAGIKRSGGITIVQDPNEADHPDMPLSVIDNMEVTHVESLSKMGALIGEKIATTEPKEVRVPYDVIVEARIDQKATTGREELSQFERAEFTCPECGGGLYVMQKDHPTHYRCQIGHSYTDRELMVRVAEVMEATFWKSLNLMEEQRTLMLRLYKKEIEYGHQTKANRFLERAKQIEEQIDKLKQILTVATDID